MTPFKAMCNEQWTLSSIGQLYSKLVKMEMDYIWALSSIGQLYSKLVKMEMDYIFGLTVLATSLVHLLQVTSVFQAH